MKADLSIKSQHMYRARAINKVIESRVRAHTKQNRTGFMQEVTSNNCFFIFFWIRKFQFPLLLINSTFVFRYWQENSERIPFSIYIHIKIFYGNTLKVRESKTLIVFFFVYWLICCSWCWCCCCSCC